MRSDDDDLFSLIVFHSLLFYIAISRAVDGRQDDDVHTRCEIEEASTASKRFLLCTRQCCVMKYNLACVILC